ncbi:hypothetical protein BS78_02G013800 [Paspalum vaginatum]|nr:hypothetical protein BS78_02G013800 [Paspalum vaginatum]
MASGTMFQSQPYTLLINLGNVMEVMNNGVFKSPVHRVVTNVENERISLGVCALKQRSNQQLVYWTRSGQQDTGKLTPWTSLLGSKNTLLVERGLLSP